MKIRLSKHSERAKAKYIIPFTYSLVGMGLFFSFYYYIKYQATTLAISCALASATACFIPVVKKITRSHLIMANYVVGIHFASVTFLSLHTGGVKASAIWWLGTVPILASFLLNATFSVIWYIIVLLDIIIISYLGKHNMLPFNVLAGASIEKLMMTSLFLCTSLITVLCVLSDMLREKTSLEKEDLQKKSFLLSQFASLGKLSSGVAHEINNPLAVIQGSHLKISRMIESSAPIDKEALSRYMEMIDRNTKRIHDITTSMRTFSDKDENKKIAKIEMQSLLNSLIDMNAKKISQNQIKVSTYFYNEPLFFNGIYTEIFQAFYNILENSFDELKNIERERRLEILLEKNDGHINVFIKDNGRGIPKKNVDRIYDPFFTTKNVGEGKGLGLTYAQNVFSHNGGNLQLESAVEDGMTTFKVMLPSEAREE